MSFTLAKGTSLVVGLGSNVYSGIITESADIEAIGELEIYKGEDNEVEAIYKSGKGQRISLSGILKSNVFSMAIGDEITVNSVSGIVEKCTIKRSAKEAKVDFSMVHYDSLT